MDDATHYSIDIKDILNNNKTNMNFPFTFHYLVRPKKSDSDIGRGNGIVWASIKNHQLSFAKLNQFVFNDQGRFGNKQAKAYLIQLVSHSKKICSTPRKREGVFEGMYGFVGLLYYYLIDNWNSKYETYHWQYLKTKQIRSNDTDDTYSRQNSMEFYKETKHQKLYIISALLLGYH